MIVARSVLVACFIVDCLLRNPICGTVIHFHRPCNQKSLSVLALCERVGAIYIFERSPKCAVEKGLQPSRRTAINQLPFDAHPVRVCGIILPFVLHTF